MARDRYTLQPDARRFEVWESNVAAKLGLGAAIDYALGWGLPSIRNRIQHLAEHLRARLAQLPGVRIHDIGANLCGLVTFTFTVAGRAADDVKQCLARHRINVSVSRVASTRLDMHGRGLQEVVRASVHYYNTVDELEMLCRSLPHGGP